MVMPLYAPKGDWQSSFLVNLKKLNASIPNKQIRCVVVNDGSNDPSIDVFFKGLEGGPHHVKYLSYPNNRGKGHALRQGVIEAETEFVIVVDFDVPYEEHNILQMINCLDGGSDVVVGKRTKQYFKQLPLKRKFISISYSLLNRMFFRLPVYDTQSGIKGFNRKGREVFLGTFIDKFLIDTEFILRASKKDLRFTVIPVDIKPTVQFSNFGASVLKEELANFHKLVRLEKQLGRQVHEMGSMA